MIISDYLCAIILIILGYFSFFPYSLKSTFFSLKFSCAYRLSLDHVYPAFSPSPHWTPLSQLPPNLIFSFFIDLFLSVYSFNSLTPVCAAHMSMGIASSTGAWATYQLPYPWRQGTLPGSYELPVAPPLEVRHWESLPYPCCNFASLFLCR